jgi:hypothetical protein
LAIVPPPVLESVKPLRIRSCPAAMPRWIRAGLLLSALALGGVFAVALCLDPYRDGRVWLAETHRQLGLPPCTFKDITGYPCPSCGMTSSFALAVRGDMWHSLEANCVGTLLALSALAFIPWALASALVGRFLGISNLERVLIWGIFGFLILMLGRWGIVLLMARPYS